MGEKILVGEDESGLREALAYNLNRERFTVQAEEDGPPATGSPRRVMPGRIVLGRMLPRVDGFEVCRILRKQSNVPILMFTQALTDARFGPWSPRETPWPWRH
ncbi:MAG: response regulator [Anaerolineales bacterium]|jgi:DNA-binding response OmpR family regulator